jgi:ubiquinone/menaquinone biosynthesis C-methylase UbiE
VVKIVASIDLGCGDNIVNTNFIGVDRRQTKYTNVIAEADNLAYFETSSIKVVFSRRCIQHVANDTKVFEEINRILTPDGVAIIEVASVFNTLISKALNYLKIKKHPYSIFHVYTKKGLRNKLESAGLKIVILGLASTNKPLFKNHIAVCIKGT